MEAKMHQELKQLRNPIPRVSWYSRSAKEYIILYYISGAPETFLYDGQRQCKAGALRSFYDLYYMCKNANKVKNITDFGNQLAELLIEGYELFGTKMYLIPSYCTTVHKVVFNFQPAAWDRMDVDVRLMRDSPRLKQVGVDGLSFNQIRKRYINKLLEQ